MTTIPHEPHATLERRRSVWQPLVREVGASLAIGTMWLAVLFDSVFGPSIVNTTPGGTSSSVPSGVVVAFFAAVASWAVARYAFGRDRRGD